MVISEQHYTETNHSITSKGDNFCDFLFASLYDRTLPKAGIQAQRNEGSVQPDGRGTGCYEA